MDIFFNHDSIEIQCRLEIFYRRRSNIIYIIRHTCMFFINAVFAYSMDNIGKTLQLRI